MHVFTYLVVPGPKIDRNMNEPGVKILYAAAILLTIRMFNMLLYCLLNKRRILLVLDM